MKVRYKLKYSKRKIKMKQLSYIIFWKSGPEKTCLELGSLYEEISLIV